MATGKLLNTVDIAPGTDGIALDAKLGRVYCPGTAKLTIVSMSDATVMGEIALPKGSKNLAVDTTTHTVWVNVNDAQGSRLVSFKPSP